MKKRFTQGKERLKSLTLSVFIECQRNNLITKSGLMGNSTKQVRIGQSDISIREILMSPNRVWQHEVPLFAQEGEAKATRPGKVGARESVEFEGRESQLSGHLRAERQTSV